MHLPWSIDESVRLLLSFPEISTLLMQDLMHHLKDKSILQVLYGEQDSLWKRVNSYDITHKLEYIRPIPTAFKITSCLRKLFEELPSPVLRAQFGAYIANLKALEEKLKEQICQEIKKMQRYYIMNNLILIHFSQPYLKNY